ncbi:Uncharacterized HTH-type transcriptional regulator y4aM, partial [Durusdinium trenchii]
MTARKAYGKTDPRVPHNMRAIRQARDMSMAQLAERLGVEVQTVQRYETEPQRLRVAMLKDIARALECSVFDLVGEDGADAHVRLEAGDLLTAMPADQQRQALAILRAMQDTANPANSNSNNEALGAMAGITFQQVQKYERGVNRLSAGRLVQFADALDADVTMFFDGLKAARAGIANTPFINADDMSAIRDLQALSPEGRKVARTTIRQLRCGMSDTFDSGRIARALFAVDAMKRRLGTVLAEELKPGMNVCWKRNGVQLGKIQSVTIKFNGSAVITVTNHYTHRTYRISEADL